MAGVVTHKSLSVSQTVHPSDKSRKYLGVICSMKGHGLAGSTHRSHAVLWLCHSYAFVCDLNSLMGMIITEYVA